MAPFLAGRGNGAIVYDMVCLVAEALDEVTIGLDAAIAEVSQSSIPSDDGCRKRS